MPDLEKVIKGWECHMEADTLKCADCPYREGWRTCNYADTLYKDVYDLLKEQEAVVRCKDCKFGKETCGNMECHKPGMKEYESDYHSFNWFCADGKHKSTKEQ